MATAAQLKAKANFKKAIAYRKKNGCSLKEAFAAVYPKKAAAKKAAPKKVAKKAAPKKKVAKKRIGSNFDAIKYLKGKYIIVKDGKVLTNSGGKFFFTDSLNVAYYWDENEKQFAENAAKLYKGKLQKIAGMKKAAPKKKAVSRHKDTNSHNVKISVVSGVNKAGNLAKYGGLIRDEKVKKVAIEYCKNRLKQLPVKERPALRRVIKQHEAELKVIKAQMLLQKKLI